MGGCLSLSGSAGKLEMARLSQKTNHVNNRLSRLWTDFDTKDSNKLIHSHHSHDHSDAWAEDSEASQRDAGFEVLCDEIAWTTPFMHADKCDFSVPQSFNVASNGID